MVAEHYRGGGWSGSQSCAHWLNWKCGINLGAAREQQQHANRALTYWYAYDGSLVVKGRLPASVGAMLVKAIEAAQEQLDPQRVSAETSRTVSP